MNDFNKWWDEDDLTTQGNPFADGTPSYWAWEGWNAGVKTEREACAKVCETEWSNVAERIYGEECAVAIRARGNT